jgi:hypothetical protein
MGRVTSGFPATINISLQISDSTVYFYINLHITYSSDTSATTGRNENKNYSRTLQKLGRNSLSKNEKRWSHLRVAQSMVADPDPHVSA